MMNEIRTIAAAVGTYFAVPPALLFAETRRKEVANARHVAWALVYDVYGYSLKRIARPFQRDHTTVLQGMRNVAERRAKDAAFDAAYRNLAASLKGGA